MRRFFVGACFWGHDFLGQVFLGQVFAGYAHHVDVIRDLLMHDPLARWRQATRNMRATLYHHIEPSCGLPRSARLSAAPPAAALARGADAAAE